MLDMRIHKKNMIGEIHYSHTILNKVKAIVNALPDELPEGCAFRAGKWAVYIDIPFNWEMYRSVRRCLRGWIPTGVHNQDDSGSKFYVLRPPGSEKYNCANLYITLNPNMAGSNCRTEVVGKREVNIVKVICEGGE